MHSIQSAIQTRLERLGEWIERDNAKDDEIARQRPTWWHAGKVLAGFGGLGKSASLIGHATGIASYAFALLFLVGGAYLIIESGQILRERWLARRT